MRHKKRFQITYIITFALEIILFWIIWFIYECTWINGFEFVSDILKFITLIGFLITVLSIIDVTSKLLNDFNNKVISINRKIATLVIFVAFIGIHSMMFISFAHGGRSIVGLMSIADKQMEDGKYYFYVTHDNHMVKIRCTKDEYENLIVDKEVLYTFTYRWLNYIKDKGFLEGNIDTTDIVDNRQSKLN